MLTIRDLHVSVEDKPVIQGLNLTVKPGEIHAIMGPNGAGKSTLAKVLAGHPDYTVDKGEILFEGINLLEVEVEERSHQGLFLGFQYPIEIAGVSNFQFLHAVDTSHRKAAGLEPRKEEEFRTLLIEKMDEIKIPHIFMDRDINGGFSGGEKKRNEILQMAVINPKLAILDETDSGLDIDAMKVVAEGINRQITSEKGLILVTHYERLLEYVSPHFVHVMQEGRITRSGGKELARQLEEEGYDSEAL